MENRIDTCCKLCLNAINITNSKDLDEWNKYTICSDCSSKILAAFNFKSACLNIENSIIAYVKNERLLPADLGQIYMKQNVQEQSFDVEEHQKVCRLCMQLIIDEFVSFADVKFGMINRYIPEINFNSTKDPVFCQQCFDSVKTHSGFIKNCLEMEEKSEIYDDKQICIKTEKIEVECEKTRTSDASPPPFHFENVKMESNLEETEEEYVVKPEQDPHVTKVDAQMDNEKESKGTLNKKEKIFKCNYCDYHSNVKSYLKKHIYRRHVNKWQKCNTCNFKTKNKYYFEKHMLRHEEPFEAHMYKCDQCNYENVYESNLKRHQLMHKSTPDVQMYKCESCDYETKYKRNINDHMAKHKASSQVRMYKCDQCNFETKHRGTISLHKIKHKSLSEKEMYECDVCSYASPYKHALVTHMLRHKDRSKVEMRKCNECSFETLRVDSLERHRLTHRDPSEIQMYECVECNFKTKHKGSLKGHQLLHRDRSQVKMHECTKCDYKAIHKSYLKKHNLKKHTPQIQGPDSSSV